MVWRAMLLTLAFGCAGSGVDSRGAPLRFEASPALLPSGPSGLSGRVVASSGDTIAFSNTADATFGELAGAVHVYVFQDGRWRHQATLHPPEPSPHLRFGEAIALDGDMLVVGVPAFSLTVSGPPGPTQRRSREGQVYVFMRAGETWSEGIPLDGPPLAAGEGRGQGVALTEDRLFVGAPFRPLGESPRVGAVYTFTRSGESLSFDGRVDGPPLEDPRRVADFGFFLVAHGDRFATNGESGTLVFRDSAEGWLEEARFEERRPLAMSAGQLLMGVGNTPNDGPTMFSGRAWRRTRTGSEWSEAAELRPPTADAFGRFGIGGALVNEVAVIGETGEAGGGAIYEFDPDARALEVPDLAAGAELGFALDWGGRWLAAGTNGRGVFPLRLAVDLPAGGPADAGAPDAHADGGAGDAGEPMDAGGSDTDGGRPGTDSAVGDAGSAPGPAGGGCGCQSAPPHASPWLVLGVWLTARRRARQPT